MTTTRVRGEKTGHGKAVLHHRIFWLTIITIAWNTIETLVALMAGFHSGSIALTGFGLDSIIEVLSALLILWKLLGQAGPGMREKGARRGIALTFLALGLWIAYESAAGLAAGRRPDGSLAGIILATLSLIVMPLIAGAKMRVGRTLHSRAILADAVETYVCAYLSFSLLLGLGLRAVLDWWWADAVAALLMAPFLIWQALETWRERNSRD